MKLSADSLTPGQIARVRQRTYLVENVTKAKRRESAAVSVRRKNGLPHEALFWRFGPQRAVRSGEWKLVEAGEGVQLFNLKDDIGEQTNLAGEQPEKLKELEARYITWNKDNIDPKWIPGDPARFLKKKARNSK